MSQHVMCQDITCILVNAYSLQISSFCLNTDFNVRKINYNAIPLTTVLSQLFTFLLLSSHLLNAIVCIIKSFLCNMLYMSYHVMEFYVTTTAASLVCVCVCVCVFVCLFVPTVRVYVQKLHV